MSADGAPSSGPPGDAPVFHSSAQVLAAAFGLALAAAVSLGLARFSYALLLPPMRADLGWSYFTAGAMNTANAAGYLLGALLAPGWLARRDARSVLLAGGLASALALAAHGVVTGEAALLVLRALTGIASAASFVAGGLLAARLGGTAAAAHRPQVDAGLVLGLYYGGVGLGIMGSALLVPPLAALRAAHAWQWAWLALAAAAAVCTLFTAATTRRLRASPVPAARRGAALWRPLAFALAGYAMFGLGYIGYMTFIVTLLREQGLSDATVVGFYVLLGAGVVASSWIWAGLLQRFRGGQTLALLNALLALATLLPVLGTSLPAAFVSGALFGGVFLSVVASTTALVRHNLPIAAWPGGIAAFTIVFAAGQIAGPVLVGRVADGPGGLARGLAISAGLLALGALLAALQRPLQRAT